MSPPPWTLFWPRSGLSPDPYRPTCPVSSASEISARTLSTALWCSVMPERPADHRPVGLRVGVRGLADRGRGDARLALRVLERVRLHGGPVRLEAGRGAVDELAVLEAGGDDLAPHRIRQRDVRAHVEAEPQVGPLRRRSSGAGPRRSAAHPGSPPSGGGGRRSGASPGRSMPHRRTTSVSSISRYELVPPPAPNTVARPATEGACQVRLQLSMLLLPRTVRTNFCAA